MNSMFNWCNNLTNLDVSKRNTSNVTNMNSMFNWCNNLTNLDVSKRNTSNVTNMNSMFNWCNNLTNLDVSKRDTSNVSSMNSMFNWCNNLLNLDVSIWNTRWVVDMWKIFRDCKSITKLDLSNWNTSNVTNMDWMFEWLGNLGTIYASKNFRTINVSSSSTLFYWDTLLTWWNWTAYDSDKISIEYAKIDKPWQQWYFTQSGSNNEQVAYLLPWKTFNTYLRSIANNWTTWSITSFSEDNVSITWFLKASNLKDGVETKISTYDSDVPIYAWFETWIIYYYTTADIIELDRDSSYMFSNMKNLKNVEIENFKTSVLRDMNTMFKWCQSIENLDLSGWSTNYVVNMNNMFEWCSGLVNLNLSNWNVNKVWSESYDWRFKSMFKWCSSLNNLILDWWNLSGLPNDSNLLQYMLEWCPITRISMRGWILPKYFEYVAWYMLRNTSVVEIDVSNRDLGITESLHDAFWNASVNRIIWINTWTWTNIVLKDISNLFESACNIEEIDMSDMDFSKVTKASSLFSYYYGTCNGYNQLKRVNLRNVKLNSVEDMSYLLKDQHFLEEVDMRNMDLSNLKNIKGMFQNDSQLKVLKMSNITFGSLENIQYFCQSCSNLEEVDLSNWNINITEYNDNNSDSLFMSASHLKDVKMPNFWKIPSTYWMFEFNNDLTWLDLVWLDTSETINMDYMFWYSQKLETIYVTDKFNTGKVETSIDMFDWAVSLVWWNWTKYDPNNVDVTYARIDNEYQPWYFTDPRHFAVKYLTTTWFELEKKWISTWSTVDKLEDSHRNYRYYTSWDLKTWFDFTKPLYWYTEIYVTWDDVHYLTYEYWTGVEEWTITSWSCIEENWEDRQEKSENCEVILPELNVLTWYHTPLWYKKWEDITYSGATIALTWDIILEAKAIANNYTVVYKPWEWTWEMQSQEFEYGKEWTLNKNKYTKEWYHFSWWIDLLWKEYRDWEPVLNLITEWILELTAQWLQNAPAAWWWQSVTPAVKEQEHEAAEEKQEIKEETKQDEKAEEQTNTPEKSNTTTNQTSTQNSSSPSKENTVTVDPEIQSAYEWAYEYNVTTIPSLDEANPDWPVTRWHLAKMVVNYATNVLGQEIPEKIPSECRWNDWRWDWESEEIKDYAVKSCALWLMWLDMPKFLPNMQVTRAQFGTIMSRLLWWKKYAWWTPYYRKHLNALKENNIMTQIDNPERRVELRQWVWLMLMRSAQNK